jgi:hypothetical protein
LGCLLCGLCCPIHVSVVRIPRPLARAAAQLAAFFGRPGISMKIVSGEGRSCKILYRYLNVWKAPKYVRKHFEALMVTTPSNHSLSCLSLSSSRCSLHSRILLSSVMSWVNLSWSCSTCSLVQISFMRSRSSGLMLPRCCNRMALSVHNGRHAIGNNRKWMGEVRLIM